MNKTNTIVICKEDYDTELDWQNAIRDACILLLNAQYIMTVRYDEHGLGIVCIDFESADQGLGANYPYWLSPNEFESVLTDEEREEIEAAEKLHDMNTQLQSAITESGAYDEVPEVTEEANKIFNEFWKDIVCKPDSDELNPVAVKNELADYHFIINQVPAVYGTVTGGVLSKPMYTADTIIRTFYENYGNLAETARLLPDDWADVTHDCVTNEDYKDAILNYLSLESD